MLVKETKQQTRQRNVKAIMEAAERVFAEAGFKGASISVIAEAAGVPKSNISYYFGSKETLYRRVIDDIFMLWLDASEELDASDDPRAALTSYIHAKMDLSRDRPYGSKVWANEIIHGAPFIQDYLEITLRKWLDSREIILRRWMQEGRLREMDPKAILYMIWASTQHYADFDHQIRTLNGNQDLTDAQWEQAKQAVTSMILLGIGIDAADIS